ncbi:hypothetical protein PoB_001164600 [Plakobranchus ocellatus]|uniref:Uncharacterized protein n=1 Tax=Plakobranchus ocellatus TaxID=259542 RepID=A0AAV3YPD7_9GAST|nr:hypothetical protein PoB_001164600 [Plakobranchus ocellatus]
MVTSPSQMAASDVTSVTLPWVFHSNPITSHLYVPNVSSVATGQVICKKVSRMFLVILPDTDTLNIDRGSSSLSLCSANKRHPDEVFISIRILLTS